MTTPTQTAPSNTLSIHDLIMTDRSEFDAAFTKAVSACADLMDSDDTPDALLLNWNMFLDGSTGLSYFYPGIDTVRKTREWQSHYEQTRQIIERSVESGKRVEGHHALSAVASPVRHFADTSEVLDMPLDDKLAQHLPINLYIIWATADAFCMELNGKLWEQGDEPLPFLRELPVDIYANRGRDLADSLFDVAVAAHHKGVADGLAASRSKKPMSKAAKKKAAAKAARKR